MKSCCPCITLKSGVTTVGFLSLIFCIVEWVLSTTFNADEDPLNVHFKNKTNEIFSLLEEFAKNKLNMKGDEEIKCFKDHLKSMFNCLTGESLQSDFSSLFPLYSHSFSQFPLLRSKQYFNVYVDLKTSHCANKGQR